MLNKMVSKFRELFEYNLHCNQKLIGLFENSLNQAPERSVVLINHIINAHQVWTSRILGQSSFHPWQMNDLMDLKSLDLSNHQATQKILSEFDLTQPIVYKNTKGEEFTNKIEDILFHLINHSTYHRGQIALLFREAGLEPLPTDYIFFKR